MNKKIVSTILGSLGLLCISSQALALNDFEVDPDSINGNGLSTFIADSISGISSGRIVLDNNTNTATESGYLNLTQFVNNGVGIFGSVSGLDGNSYQLYALFDLEASLVSGTFGAAGSVYNLTQLDFTIYADPNLNTTFVQAGFGSDATVGGTTADDFALATGAISSGQAFINLGGVALNAETTFDLTSPDGEAYFIDPVPFYNMSFDAFNNTGGAVQFNYDTSVGCTGPGCEIVVLSGVGTLDFFNDVPEPATVMLLGIGLLGIGASRLRRKA